MANILLAACDGNDGNPGEYRDYRFKRFRDLPAARRKSLILFRSLFRSGTVTSATSVSVKE